MALNAVKAPVIKYLILYHQDDKRTAENCLSLLREGGIEAHLFYRVVGANVDIDVYRLADGAHCVISILTQRLFTDNKSLMLHRKVHRRLEGERFIAVDVDLSADIVKSAAAGFLEGCHMVKMSAEDFSELLPDAVKAAARRADEIASLSLHDEVQKEDQATQVGNGTCNISDILDANSEEETDPKQISSSVADDRETSSSHCFSRTDSAFLSNTGTYSEHSQEASTRISQTSTTAVFKVRHFLPNGVEVDAVVKRFRLSENVLKSYAIYG